MKYSIVMTHVNREKQLDNTLFSISLSKIKKEDYEIIIVDDNSYLDQDARRIVEKYNEVFNVKYLKIKNFKKNHNNSCLAFNYGFSISDGNNIIIQNSECLHFGDLLNFCDNLEDLNNKYYAFSCYSLSKKSTDLLFDLEHRDSYFNDISKSINFNNIGATLDHSDSWYNHELFRKVDYHFCSIISRENLKKINGFDEEYKFGLDYDDNEFLHRIKLSGVGVQTIPSDKYFVIHQFHENSRKEIENIKNINYNIFYNKTLKNTDHKANQQLEILR